MAIRPVAAIVATLFLCAAGSALAAEPTFVDGESQPVFSTNSNDWTNEELWIQSSVDSDGDGSNDLIHADVSRVPETNAPRFLKVPVILEVSPYYAGIALVTNNWNVDHEIGQPPDSRIPSQPTILKPTSPTISTIYESTWVPRGFAVMHAESIGSGLSEGCATSGDHKETLAAKAVIDWLGGRAKGYTSPLKTAEVTASWFNGRAGMMGTSYNGTLPTAVATTGVPELKAWVPISGISNWYDYYRANGMVRAPGLYQGEDLDVLAEYVYSRPHREICRAVIDELARMQDRRTGDYSAFWDDRNYMKDIGNVTAAALVAHGNNDNNVMTKNAAQLYEALKARGLPHALYWHQGGHGGSPPLTLLNKWFTRYLWDVPNIVDSPTWPRAWVVREGAPSSNPTPYAEWPDPAAAAASVNLSAGAPAAGGLTFRLGDTVAETLTDDASQTALTLANAASSPNRLVFKSAPLSADIRISGTPRVSLRLAFSKPKANVTAILASYPASGSAAIVTRGWMDPENRVAIDRTDPLTVGTMYDLNFDLQPRDSVIAAGRRLALIVMSSDNEHTIRPAAGTQLTLDLAQSSVSIPVVGGAKALAEATGVTVPTIAHSLTPASPTGTNGWYTGDVSLAWQVGDGGAQVTKTGCADAELTADGVFTRSCTASNVVGATGPVSVTVKRDATDPTISLTRPQDGSTYAQNSVVTAAYGCDDATAGVATCTGTVASGDAIDTSSTGQHTFTVTARDDAGNTRTRTVTYTVANGPTAVRLRSFTARRSHRGTALRWRTASESQLVGYRVYRVRSARKLAAVGRLVPAERTSRGHVYTVLDRRSKARGVRYLLQAVKLDGSRIWLSSAMAR